MSIVNEYYFQRADLDIKIAAVFDVFFIRYFSNNFALYRGDLNSQEYHRDNMEESIISFFIALRLIAQSVHNMYVLKTSCRVQVLG